MIKKEEYKKHPITEGRCPKRPSGLGRKAKDYKPPLEYTQMFEHAHELCPSHAELIEQGYYYNKYGQLRSKEGEKEYKFISTSLYELISEIVIRYVQEILRLNFEMVEKWLPDITDEGYGNNIFISKDYLENKEKCLVLIQGTGRVRAGIWSRSVCVNEDLIEGSMLPFVQEGIMEGYSLLIFNPNLNRDSTTGKLIPGHRDMSEHCLTIWSQILSQSPANNLYVVAHSAGGRCLNDIYQQDSWFTKRVGAVALTDSWFHPIKEKDKLWVKGVHIFIQSTIKRQRKREESNYQRQRAKSRQCLQGIQTMGMRVDLQDK